MSSGAEPGQDGVAKTPAYPGQVGVSEAVADGEQAEGDAADASPEQSRADGVATDAAELESDDDDATQGVPDSTESIEIGGTGDVGAGAGAEAPQGGDEGTQKEGDGKKQRESVESARSCSQSPIAGAATHKLSAESGDSDFDALLASYVDGTFGKAGGSVLIPLGGLRLLR